MKFIYLTPLLLILTTPTAFADVELNRVFVSCNNTILTETYRTVDICTAFNIALGSTGGGGGGGSLSNNEILIQEIEKVKTILSDEKVLVETERQVKLNTINKLIDRITELETFLESLIEKLNQLKLDLSNQFILPYAYGDTVQDAFRANWESYKEIKEIEKDNLELDNRIIELETKISELTDKISNIEISISDVQNQIKEHLETIKNEIEDKADEIEDKANEIKDKANEIIEKINLPNPFK